ncbi:hypothetical protein HPP92_011602 [Vanilla planifolia]|nr:hypothetical protein HPP92_011602 [Vanilla planifolia]
MESLDVSKGHIDLNCRPHRDAEQQAAGSSRLSMMSLLQVASLPLEVYLKQNKLAGLATSEQQVSMSPAEVPQAPVESESGEEDEHCVSDTFAS